MSDCIIDKITESINKKGSFKKAGKVRPNIESFLKELENYKSRKLSKQSEISFSKEDLVEVIETSKEEGTFLGELISKVKESKKGISIGFIEGIGGIYNRSTNKVSIGKDNSLDTAETILIHELIHAIQGENTFDMLSDESKKFINTQIEDFKKLEGVVTKEEYDEVAAWINAKTDLNDADLKEEAIRDKSDNLKKLEEKLGRGRMEFIYLANIAQGKYTTRASNLSEAQIQRYFTREYTAIFGSSKEFRDLVTNMRPKEDQKGFKRVIEDIVNSFKTSINMMVVFLKQDGYKYRNNVMYQRSVRVLNEVLDVSEVTPWEGHSDYLRSIGIEVDSNSTDSVISSIISKLYENVEKAKECL